MTEVTPPKARDDYRNIFEGLKNTTRGNLPFDSTARLTLSADSTTTLEERDLRVTHSLPRLELGQTQEAHFQIGKQLGEGGRGIVYLASQTTLAREVAIKSSLVADRANPANTELLLEARAMGYVEHPNVVPVHLIGQDELGRPIIVMKHVKGQPWSDFIGTHLPNEDDLDFHLRIFTGVCQAVAYAHSRGVIHRDIKPQNIMVGDFGEVYLLDWGLAASISDKVTHLPSAATLQGVAGTPVYMAPEMTLGSGDKLSKQTDIYLLGASLFHALTNTLPNDGKTLFQILSFSYTGQKRRYPPGFPSELRQICERAMAHNPQARFPDADALRIAVLEFLKHRSSHALTEIASKNAEQMETSTGEELQTKFNEVRFGFASALQIWPDNPVAKTGLASALHFMINYELDEGNIIIAKRLFGELETENDSLKRKIKALEWEHRRAQEKLDRIAFDYNERIGSSSRRLLIASMAVTFAMTPWVLELFRGRTVPSYLLWISDDSFLIAANAIGVLFLPAMAAAGHYTYRRLWDHKTSRIFVKSMMGLFLTGMFMRSLSLTGSVPLNYAAAAECSVYSTGLTILGMAIDRRLGPPAFFYMLTSFALVFADWSPLTIYASGSVIACVSFLVYGKAQDKRTRRPKLP